MIIGRLVCRWAQMLMLPLLLLPLLQLRLCEKDAASCM
jgi:hypothetical protein